MEKISENLLHFLWRNRLFSPEDIEFLSDEPLEILRTGQHNTDAGPDFFNAGIKIGNTQWAGNIEFHLKSSDWIKHGHHKNEAYDSVILQLVLQNDMTIFRTTGEPVPTAIFKPNKEILKKYESLISSEHSIPCYADLQHINSFQLHSWFNALWAERIEKKSDDIKRILQYTTQNWEETFYINLARSFGSKVNAEPFELLAKSLPSIVLAKHKSSRFQLEALLFGQAGMLEDACEDEYFLVLKKEYQFLKAKYQLKPIAAHLWKFMRLRPANFPTLRISQLAHLVSKSSHLFSKLIENENITSIEANFDCETSEYWHTHFRFGKPSAQSVKNFGKTAVHGILVNTLLPILFLYGKERDKYELTERAVQFAEQLKAEKNAVTEKWLNVGIKNENAFASQALTQLYNAYCEPKRCSDCRIGGLILQKQIKQNT